MFLRIVIEKEDFYDRIKRFSNHAHVPQKIPSLGDSIQEKNLTIAAGQETWQKRETQKDLQQLQKHIVSPEGNRIRSNELWQESLGPEWKKIEKLDFQNTEKLVLVTHPLWGFLSQKTYSQDPSHITTLWFDYIKERGIGTSQPVYEFKKFITQYVTRAAEEKHVSVLERKNIFYILENLHLLKELSQKTSPDRACIFVLPQCEGGKNTPTKKEYQQYSSLLKGLLSDIPNKYFTSSKEWGSGYLFEEDVKKLGEFSINKTVTSVGGYVGRCLSNTWRSFDLQNRGKFKIELDTILPIHGSRDIGNIEMTFNDALWKMLLQEIADNEHFSFEDLIALTEGELWEMLSVSLDEKSLKKTDARRQGPSDIKIITKGGRLSDGRMHLNL
ncbi:hypothetical protein HC823_00110 [Candidatus Gracilibacteria bacterium]|nr:hypothetical protein [Candidatus Gracilibacteria bacterium]